VMELDSSDENYHKQILPHLSRSFALSILQLPTALRTPVTNEYLLRRIVDTIEDEPQMWPGVKFISLERFVAVVHGEYDARLFAGDLLAQLSERTPRAERELVLHMEHIIRVTLRLNEPQRRAVARCVEVMYRGMHQFQHITNLLGLARLSDLDKYCYYVAGVVAGFRVIGPT
jgi:farnesyl-diphosphate farnesyltransferase